MQKMRTGAFAFRKNLARRVLTPSGDSLVAAVTLSVSPSLFRKRNIAWINIEQINVERL
jgi:hypothetical protein